MEMYRFKAKDAEGEEVIGTIRAHTEKAAAKKLRNTYSALISLEVVDESTMLEHLPRVRYQDLSVATRQIGVCIRAGIPVHNAFRFVMQGAESPGLRLVLASVLERIEAGMTISKSLAVHKRTFSPTYVALVKAGETSGKLGESFDRLADLTERSIRLQKQVTSSLTYPAIVCMFALSMAAMFVYFILPMMLPMFTQLKVELPLPTRILLWIGWVASQPLLMLPAVVGAVLAIVAVVRAVRKADANPAFRRWLDTRALKLPVFGLLLERAVWTRMLFTLATLLDAGITMEPAMAVTEAVAGNCVVADKLKAARDQMVEGAGVFDALSAHEVFDKTILQMIHVGEESGQIDDMMARIASLYEEDVAHRLEGLTAMLEPLLMGVMGLAVGFLTLASFLPMASLLKDF